MFIYTCIVSNRQFFAEILPLRHKASNSLSTKYQYSCSPWRIDCSYLWFSEFRYMQSYMTVETAIHHKYENTNF